MKRKALNSNQFKNISHGILSVLILMIFGANSNVQAQIVPTNTIECGTELTSENEAYLDELLPTLKKYEDAYHQLVGGDNKNITGTESTSSALTFIPIKAHIIRTDNGTGGLSVSDLTDAIEVVNTYYADIFIKFFLCDGINYVDDSYFYDFLIEEEQDSLVATHEVDGLFNVYFFGTIYRTSNSSFLSGNSTSIGNEYDAVSMKNDDVDNETTLAHEFGHFFGLRHTHHGGGELANGSNCATSGDGFCDTPADPTLGSAVVNSSCIYTGNATDSNGDAYAPSTNNLMSYSRKVCRTEFTPQQLARMYAMFIVERNNFACPSFSVGMTADIPDECLVVNTTISFTDSSVGATSWFWDVDGDDIIDYTIQNPSHTYPNNGVYDVALTISNGTDTITKVYPEFMAIGPQKSVPYSENFNSFWGTNFDGWKAINVDGNNYNWLTQSGVTPSSNNAGVDSITGPLGDNSGTSNGRYIYAEASASNPGDVALLTSPCILINSPNAELSFAYHMYSNNSGHMGDLHVDIDPGTGFINDVIPMFSGIQQNAQDDPYLIEVIDLSTYANQTIRIRFRAVRGSGWRSDAAIDDIQITGDAFSSANIGELNLNDLIFYPNPATKTINFSSEYDNTDFIIYSILGNVAKQGIITSSIDVSNLSIGTYILRVSKDDKTLTKKLIIE